MPRRIICSRCENFKTWCRRKHLGTCEHCWIESTERNKDPRWIVSIQREKNRREEEQRENKRQIALEERRSWLAETTIPLFRFPLEIRNIIYEAVFQNPTGLVAPDPTRTRRQHDRELTDRTINAGLALLQTCQQVHEEDTAVSYGSTSFYFDGTQHGKERFQIEVSDHCHYCQRETRDRSSGGGVLFRHICWDARNGKHHIDIPQCDFVTMHDWLSTIGERNRLKLKHLQLCFYGSQFAEVIGENHPGGKEGRPSPVGGDLLEKALKLPASRHNLDTIKDIFGNVHRGLLSSSDVGMASSSLGSLHAALCNRVRRPPEEHLPRLPGYQKTGLR